MKGPQDDRSSGWPGAAPLILGVALAGAGLSLALASNASGMSETGTTPSGAEASKSTDQTGMAAGVDEDRRLAQRIERRLAWDVKLAPYDLEVTVNNSIVNLSGTLSTMAESHRARRIADETKGVGGVVNATYVDPALIPFEDQSLTPPDDETLTKRLKVTLANDPALAVETIQVEIEDGVVRLHGTLRDYTSEMRAKRVAESLYGVERVDSELTVAAP